MRYIMQEKPNLAIPNFFRLFATLTEQCNRRFDESIYRFFISTHLGNIFRSSTLIVLKFYEKMSSSLKAFFMAHARESSLASENCMLTGTYEIADSSRILCSKGPFHRRVPFVSRRCGTPAGRPQTLATGPGPSCS